MTQLLLRTWGFGKLLDNVYCWQPEARSSVCCLAEAKKDRKINRSVTSFTRYIMEEDNLIISFLVNQNRNMSCGLPFFAPVSPVYLEYFTFNILLFRENRLRLWCQYFIQSRRGLTSQRVKQNCCLKDSMKYPRRLESPFAPSC